MSYKLWQILTSPTIVNSKLSTDNIRNSCKQLHWWVSQTWGPGKPFLGHPKGCPSWPEACTLVQCLCCISVKIHVSCKNWVAFVKMWYICKVSLTKPRMLLFSLFHDLKGKCLMLHIEVKQRAWTLLHTYYMHIKFQNIKICLGQVILRPFLWWL